MNIANVYIYINSASCLVIMFRLMFFKKAGRYRFRISLLAYLMIVASGWTLFRLLWGTYTLVDPAELVLNLFFSFAIVKARGNLAKISDVK